VVDGGAPEMVENADVVADSGLTRAYLDSRARQAVAEIARRRRAYLGARPHVPLAGRTAIVVDDGIATGTSVRAALAAMRKQSPAALVLAVPVAPAPVLAELAPLVEAIVCPSTPEPFDAVGRHYRDFHQLTDAEVVAAIAAVG
jgi:putative phosphoribosyl transferase